MSTHLTVGRFADLRANDAEGFAQAQKDFARIYDVLQARGLPAFNEPETLTGGFYATVTPPNGIAYLQRLAVYLWKKNTLPPPLTALLGNPLADPDIEFAYEDCYFDADVPNRAGQRFVHLVCHSPRDNWYLPVDFSDPIVEERREYGSAVRLEAECAQVASALRLPLDLEPSDPSVLGAMDNLGSGAGWERYGIEAHNCLLLHKAARRAQEVGAAILLH